VTGISGGSASNSRKRGRPLGPKAKEIRAAVVGLTELYDLMTVRQIFYALTVRGVVEKTEAGYRQVQTQVLRMRRDGLLPWSFIADSTRRQRKPDSYDTVKDALAEVTNTYRRNLWRTQQVRIEVWLEKDALASVVMGVTVPWDVPLMVSRGQSSDTFCYQAAQEARNAWENGITTHIFALYDADRSGRNAAEQIRKKLQSYSGGAPIVFQLPAVTDRQIEEWSLPTRPAKENADETAVELDAIPPERLTSLVHEAIEALVDPDAWNIEVAVEESEREILRRMG
jgi:hypothetical protein